MKKLNLVLPINTTVLLTAIILTFSGCSYKQSNATNPTINQHQTNLGTVLTNRAGMTLYTFSKDISNVSNCNNGCAIKWPPLLANNKSVANGRFSIITRSDNHKQWALDGKPLYTWIKDKQPGDTTGEGIKSLWHVAKP